MLSNKQSCFSIPSPNCCTAQADQTTIFPWHQAHAHYYIVCTFEAFPHFCTPKSQFCGKLTSKQSDPISPFLYPFFFSFLGFVSHAYVSVLLVLVPHFLVASCEFACFVWFAFSVHAFSGLVVHAFPRN